MLDDGAGGIIYNGQIFVCKNADQISVSADNCRYR